MRTNIQVHPRKLATNSYKYNFSHMGNGNDDISSEEHFKNLKTKRSSYFLLEQYIFVKIFESYLVAQSLSVRKSFVYGGFYITFCSVVVCTQFSFKFAV
jgi:hypothetical protein